MRYKQFWSFLGLVFLAVGCARVQVEAPKEPIRMDVTMRLDIYQHVVKDIDNIEDIVNGKSPAKTVADVIIPNAHADDLSPEVEKAALRRRDRLAEINSLKSSGAAQEGKDALLAGSSPVVNAENSDRMIIYRALAQKNGTSVEEVQKIYAERLK